MLSVTTRWIAFCQAGGFQSGAPQSMIGAAGRLPKPGGTALRLHYSYASPYVRKVMAVAIETGQRKSWR